MKLGVFLFYGVKDMRSLDIVQSLTRTFRMPFLSPSTPTLNIKPGTSGYQINMKPETAYAIIDMITYFGWNKVIYVYDSDEGKSLLSKSLFHQEKYFLYSGHGAIICQVVARSFYTGRPW